MSIIEARPYGPDSTREEIEALRARVYLHDDGDIIAWHQVPVQSLFQLELFFAKNHELASSIEGPYGLLADLREAGRPPLAIRTALKKGFHEMELKPHHMAVVSGKNIVLNVAAKFVLSGVLNFNFSVHKDWDDAYKALCNARP